MKRRRHRKKNWDGHFYIQACSYIHTRLTHNCAFTQRPYHTNTLLHTDIIHTNTFTHRDAFTHKTLFDTQTPLHIIKPFAQSPFRHKHFYTQKKYTNMTPAAKHMQELIAKHATSLNSSLVVHLCLEMTTEFQTCHQIASTKTLRNNVVSFDTLDMNCQDI